MIEVTVNTGTKELNTQFTEMQKGLNQLTVPLKQSGIYMLGSIDRNFRSQGRPNKWKQLRPSTIKRRRKEGKDLRILQDEGRLKQNITTKVKDDQTVSIGTNVEYAPTHQFGRTMVSRGGTTVIPQRKFLLFQKEDEKIIQKIFSDHIGKVLSKGTVVFRG